MRVGQKLRPEWVPETDKHLVRRPAANDWRSGSGGIGRDGRHRDLGIDDEENHSRMHTGSFSFCNTRSDRLGPSRPESGLTPCSSRSVMRPLALRARLALAPGASLCCLVHGSGPTSWRQQGVGTTSSHVGLFRRRRSGQPGSTRLATSGMSSTEEQACLM